MKIEELQRKHQDIYVEDDLREEFKQHRNLSIEFTISILEEFASNCYDYSVLLTLGFKIEELKKELNG